MARWNFAVCLSTIYLANRLSALAESRGIAQGIVDRCKPAQFLPGWPILDGMLSMRPSPGLVAPRVRSPPGPHGLSKRDGTRAMTAKRMPQQRLWDRQCRKFDGCTPISQRGLGPESKVILAANPPTVPQTTMGPASRHVQGDQAVTETLRYLDWRATAIEGASTRKNGQPTCISPSATPAGRLPAIPSSTSYSSQS